MPDWQDLPASEELSDEVKHSAQIMVAERCLKHTTTEDEAAAETAMLLSMLGLDNKIG